MINLVFIALIFLKDPISSCLALFTIRITWWCLRLNRAGCGYAETYIKKKKSIRSGVLVWTRIEIRRKEMERKNKHKHTNQNSYSNVSVKIHYSKVYDRRLSINIVTAINISHLILAAYCLWKWDKTAFHHSLRASRSQFLHQTHWDLCEIELHTIA